MIFLAKMSNIYIYIYIYIYTFTYIYIYIQQSALYLERLYLVLRKYSSIRLQVSCCCNHQVYIIYDPKITKKIYYVLLIEKYPFMCSSVTFKFHFTFLSSNLSWCLQLLINSFCLFNKRLSSIKSMIYKFSRRYNLQ